MKVLKIALALLAAAAAYLLLWPTGMDPVAWTPPPAPKLEGVYAANGKLKGIQKIGSGIGQGPEGVNVDAIGRVYAGYRDGRIMMFSPDGASYTELAKSPGRPLGITFGPNGGLVIADAQKGLLHFGSKLRRLAKEADGVPFGFTDDVDNTRLDKNVYFTDASSKFGWGHHMSDILEHGANGRLLEYSFATKKTRVLMSGLHFANGVAVGPDDQYVLVNETGEYRILRYWLQGAKAGTHDVFIDNLPGFPDNLSYNDRGLFWVALAGPRDPLIDQLLPGSFFLRKLIARLPEFMLPIAKKSLALGIDVNGKVVTYLEYDGRDAFAPITSVREHGPWLYFGSLTYPAIGRLPLNQVLPGSPPPPAGWETVPEPKEQKVAAGHEEEEEHEREERERGAEGGDEDLD